MGMVEWNTGTGLVEYWNATCTAANFKLAMHLGYAFRPLSQPNLGLVVVNKPTVPPA